MGEELALCEVVITAEEGILGEPQQAWIPVAAEGLVPGVRF